MYPAIQREGKAPEVPNVTLHFVFPFFSAITQSQRVKGASERRDQLPGLPHYLWGSEKKKILWGWLGGVQVKGMEEMALQSLVTG